MKINYDELVTRLEVLDNKKAVKNCEDIEKILYVDFSESKNKLYGLIKYANVEAERKVINKIRKTEIEDYDNCKKITRISRNDYMFQLINSSGVLSETISSDDKHLI